MSDIYSILESVTVQEHALELCWNDNKTARFHYLWLRDNCPSNLHPDTQERVFDLLSVSDGIYPVSAEVENGSLTIHWSEQNHISVFEGEWLLEHGYSGDLSGSQQSSTKSWGRDFAESFTIGDYHDIIASDQSLYQWMKQLDQDGLILVDNMPAEAAALTAFTDRIDYQRRTNFGTMFEVKTEPNPINLAYTAIALPLHTDLANQETPPGYQFLHCLANESEGGASTFADGLRILEELREEAPEHFELLAAHSIPFRFHDHGHDIRSHHPVINLDHKGNIVELKYNAHLASIFDLPEDIMHDYYLAYRNLMERVKSGRYTISYKLKKGQMVVFDNRRVMHGREAYNPSGRRHLRGCYVDRTEFKSRLRVLATHHAS